MSSSSSSKQGSDDSYSSSACLSKGITDLETVFSDIKPILQDDGPSPVCAIAYPPDFEEAMNYFRAVLLAQEYSSRALDLTSICLKFNPANYTIWHFRRECLKALSTSPDKISIDKDLVEKDLEFSAKIGGSNPKNYQIWYHRRALLESILEGKLSDNLQVSVEDLKERIFDVTRKELMYVSIILNEDAKNYHAWSHRQWLIRCSVANHTCESLWEDELKYVHSLLEDDIRNNSAWNHRWFIVHKCSTSTPLLLELAQREAKFALDAAERDPWNESPWSYFIGIVREQTSGDRKEDEANASFLGFCETEVDSILQNFKKTSTHEGEECPNIISAMIDILEIRDDLQSLTRAAQLASELATVHDKIRLKYWLYREKEFRVLIDKKIS